MCYQFKRPFKYVHGWCYQSYSYNCDTATVVLYKLYTDLFLFFIHTITFYILVQAPIDETDLLNLEAFSKSKYINIHALFD